MIVVAVQPGGPPAADEEVGLHVADRLERFLTSPSDRVMVEVQNRVVILEGAVASTALRDRLHRLVWQTSGVADVCNRLAAGNEEGTLPGRQWV